MAGAGISRLEQLSKVSEAEVKRLHRWALDAFWKFELPEDLVTGYGYPQLTTQAKKKILGGNLARLMGIDVEQKVAQLRG